MTGGTQQTAQTVHARDSAPSNDSRVVTHCAGCPNTAPGIRPQGWLVFATYGRIGKVSRAIVGEFAFCPDCRRAGRVQWPETR